MNSAWKKINAVCLPFITNVYFLFSFPRRLSYAFRGVQNANTETQFNIYIYVCIYICIRYETGIGKERVEGEGGGAQSLSRLCDSFILRNASFCFAHSACVILNCKRISILYKSMS